jgi:hypothetical protein
MSSIGIHQDELYSEHNLSINNWGSSYWYIIHNIAMSDCLSKEHILYFFFNLTYILPCDKCKSKENGYPYYLSVNPINFNDLFKWTYDLHNFVNNKTHKLPFKLSCDEIKHKFRHMSIKYDLFVVFLLNLVQIGTKNSNDDNLLKIISNVLHIVAIAFPRFGKYMSFDKLQRSCNITCHEIADMVVHIVYKLKKNNKIVAFLKDADFNKVEEAKCYNERCAAFS